ncbi:MAG: hypothetical protein KAR44_02605 [Candidatus Aegiribacteria sp.]|nr:hypothetical protein [Candidatus Aegiribacteria sp.]
MKNKGKFQNGLIPPALSIVFAAGLLPLDTASASDQSSNQTDSVDRGSADSISPSLFTRTSLLWSNPQWQEFKRLWRKLDSIGPVDGDYSLGNGNYEEYEKIRMELDNSYIELMRISEEIGIDSIDVRLLHRLASDRLDILSYGSRMPFTRMMPSPVSNQTDHLITQIENRIDTVVSLREEGLLSSGEMIAAFSNLRSSINSYFLLETISNSTYYSGVLWTVTWPLEADRIQPHLDSIRTSLMDNLTDTEAEDSEELYSVMLDDLESMEQSLSRARDRMPALHDLLMDLELF